VTERRSVSFRQWQQIEAEAEGRVSEACYSCGRVGNKKHYDVKVCWECMNQLNELYLKQYELGRLYWEYINERMTKQEFDIASQPIIEAIEAVEDGEQQCHT
jgi:hypothetical protein